MSLDPRDHDWVNNDSIFSWRQYLKSELVRQRGNRSDYSGKPLSEIEMHEGIVTRAVVPKGIWWHYFIFHPYNCFLVSPEEHKQYGHVREWAIQSAYSRYGRDTVIMWFESLPFKVKPFRLL
ncbi:MAG: hypothetical protein WC196_04505 [Bacilli bacterium]|jgi:hypothetical protein